MKTMHEIFQGIPLLSHQSKHKESVKWLISSEGNSQDGRSFLMAYLYIEIAMENPGIAIYYTDHNPALKASVNGVGDILRGLTKKMMQEFKFFNDTGHRIPMFEVTRNYIKYIP
jgi:hypothetical protein